MQFPKLRVRIVAVVCALLIAISVPQKVAAASMVEYTVVTFIILVVTDTIKTLPVPMESVDPILDQLILSVVNAQAASERGDRSQEIAWIGRASGDASALAAFTASCDDPSCEVVREDAQKIVALLAHRKSILLASFHQ